MKQFIKVITLDKLEDFEHNISKTLLEILTIKHVIMKLQSFHPFDQNDVAVLKYILKPNVDAVAKEMNSEGYRIKSPFTGKEIKYNSNDITALISLTDTELKGKSGIYEFARALYRFNTGKIGWKLLNKICEKLLINKDKM
jgi:hypothetical protein